MGFRDFIITEAVLEKHIRQPWVACWTFGGFLRLGGRGVGHGRHRKGVP